MDGISSRKRPFDATNSDGDGGCTNNNVGGTSESPKILHTPLSCKISAVAAEREEDMEGNMNASDDQSDGDDGDISEILDLQKALEYLVSTRDIEKIYNTDKQYAIDANNKDNEEVMAQEKKETGQLYMIPNLVNRIIMERYSPATNPNQHDADDDTNDAQDMHKNNRQTEMSRKQKDKLTKLLIAVILEFAEPYFVRISRYKQQKRAKKLKQLKQKEMAKQTTPPQDSSSFHELDKRATHWATSCINQLLQSPSPISSLSSSILSNNSNGNNKQITTLAGDDTYNIPEIDALLSASGGHDGLDMETCMQSALMRGLQARRLLQNHNENK